MGGISKTFTSAGPSPDADTSGGTGRTNGAAYTTAGRQPPTAGAGSESAGDGSTGADQVGVGGVESVGVADAERLVAEAEAAAATVPADELSAQIEGKLGAQAAQLTSWTQITGDGIDIVAICLLPQWHLTDAERKRMSERLARMLDLLCPVRMSPVIEAVVGVGLCAGGIVASRAITNGGRLPPLGPPKPTEKPADKPTRVDPMTVTSLTQ